VARAKLAAKISIPYVARFFRFFEFLASAPIAYRNVMLTDVRDVFFQRDPFDFDIGNRVNCFLEDERQTLGSERHNRAWLTTAYGEEVARSLADKPISCSGVTIGSRDAVFEYLRVLVGELLELRTQSVGIDQGVHNYVLHRELVPRSALLRNWDGPVLTLALVPPAEVEAAARNGRLNANVLHQYNHHPQLSARLLHELVA
jgi:hypothetical protein